MKRFRMLHKFMAYLLIAFVLLKVEPAYSGTCASPYGNEADSLYNSASHTYQFCNGTSWMGYGGGSSCTTSGSYTPIPPSGSGYFVLTNTTYNGNIGGGANSVLAPADSDCLTDLTTHTSWMGYATANSNGQLIAAKVHAFFCDGADCGNLMPLTTYYFANGANGSAGGASFTTDSNGNGPQDSANWSGSTYFGGTYSYWSSRNSGSSTVWSSGIGCGGANSGCNCSNWASTSGTGIAGTSAATDSNRWNSTTPSCGTPIPIICVVNP